MVKNKDSPKDLKRLVKIPYLVKKELAVVNRFVFCSQYTFG